MTEFSQVSTCAFTDDHNDGHKQKPCEVASQY